MTERLEELDGGEGDAWQAELSGQFAKLAEKAGGAFKES
jgi:hypothetical protein